MDFASLAALAAGINSTVDLLRNLGEGDGSAQLDELNERFIQLRTLTIEVQSTALTLLQENYDLAKRVSELEAERAKLADWGAEKEQYEMQAIGGTAFVYALKPGFERPEPPHWLCHLCFDKNQKSILCYEARAAERRPVDIWICARCSSRIRVPWGQEPTMET